VEVKRRKKRINWAPYLLILPSVLYLIIFFAWPMTQALRLAIWERDALLSLRQEAVQASFSAGRLPQGAQVDIVDRQGNLILPDTETANLLTEVWYQISGLDSEGQAVTGWAPQTRIRIRQTAADGSPIAGTVRPRLGADTEPLTTLYSEPHDNSPPTGRLAAGAEVNVIESAILEVWYLIQAEHDGALVSGWAPSRYVQAFGDGAVGRIDRGDSGQLTTRYVSRMINDRFFWPALRTTVLLILIIIPIQFTLAVIMALVVQARLKGNTAFLYIFAIPLAVSDLAVGIVWFSIFTQNGYLNSMLQALGLISSPNAYLTADTRHWIIIAIVLAEVWRATSLVMVIIVSGLQAISQEVLEAAELFGATLWQRVRHVILPMLRPSLQVALILRTILALQVFAVVVALSGGDVVTVLANETYRQYDILRNPNVAAAYASFILLLSMISAIFYLRTLRTQEEALE
jgi:multiple sugar transport system permease protein